MWSKVTAFWKLTEPLNPRAMYYVHSSIYLNVHVWHSYIYLHLLCTKFYLPECTVYSVLSTCRTVYTVLTTCMYSLHSSIYLHVQFVPGLMLVYRSVKVLKDVFVLFDDRWLCCSDLHSVVPEEIQHHFKNCKQFFSTNLSYDDEEIWKKIPIFVVV